MNSCQEKKTLPRDRDGKGASTFGPQNAYRYPCFQAKLGDIRGSRNGSRQETAMSPPAFDPFGEPVPTADSAVAPEYGSNWLKSAGVGLFWGLVGIIVLARAIYFEAGAFSFGQAVAWAQGLLALL